MHLQRPDDSTGGSRFLLALSLSTVTVIAVAAPLALKALDVRADAGGQDADVSEISETSTTTTTSPSGPQIGPKVRSPQAKLPIVPGRPSDYPDESVVETEQARIPTTTATTVATTVASTTTTGPLTSSSTTETTVETSSSTSSSIEPTSSSTSPSTSIEADSAPGTP